MLSQSDSQVIEISKIDPRSVSGIGFLLSFFGFIFLVLPFWLWNQRESLTLGVSFRMIAFGLIVSLMGSLLLRFIALAYTLFSSRFGGVLIELKKP